MIISTLKEARRLWDLGFAIHWLHPKSKRPLESGWTTGPRKSWEELEFTYKEGYNVGVRLGKPSGIFRADMGSAGDGGNLAVIDVDIKSEDPKHRREALAALKGLLGKNDSCPVVTSGRGNGSRHVYCLTRGTFKTFNPAQSLEIVKVPMPSKKPSKKELETLTPSEIAAGMRLSHAWEISLYSDGRQVVLPPSIHPDTGKAYAWKTKLTEATDLPFISFEGTKADFSEDAVGCGIAREDRMDWEGRGSETEGLLASERSEDATLRDFKIEEVDISWLPISDKVREGILHGIDVADRSGYLLLASSALLSAGLTQNEVLSVLTDRSTFLGAVGYEHAKTKDRRRAAEWVFKFTLKKVNDERDPTTVFSKASKVKPARDLTPEEMEAQNEDLLSDRNWRQDLDKTAKGKTTTSLKNLDLIFTNEIEGAIFKKDLFANRVAYGTNTPWGGEDGKYLEDIDMVLVKRWLSDTEFGIEPSTNAILEATSLVAHRLAVHPVREWLGSLTWDGTPRINTWLRDYCQGKAEEPYLSEVSRKFLLAMVKRVFDPGCQWDYVLVLEGKQGKYKSSIARAIASDRWFMDNLPDLKDKDAMLNLQGKWLIELGELTNVKRSDHNQVKAYLARRTDTVRPHYGRIMADVPRQSVFIGTVNEGQYLKDPTGNRRFWPVRVGDCDVPGLKAVRDQLFAEAVSIYQKENEALMLSPAADLQASEAQEDRRIDDDETGMRDSLVEFMDSEPAKEFDFDRFKIKELMVGVNAPWGSWGPDKYAQNTGAQVLRNLGFERRKIHGQRIWGKGKDFGINQASEGLISGHGGQLSDFKDDVGDFL